MPSWLFKKRTGRQGQTSEKSSTGHTVVYSGQALQVEGQTTARPVISAPVPVPFGSFLEARAACLESGHVSTFVGGEPAQHQKKRWKRIFSRFGHRAHRNRIAKFRKRAPTSPRPMLPGISRPYSPCPVILQQTEVTYDKVPVRQFEIDSSRLGGQGEALYSHPPVQLREPGVQIMPSGPRLPILGSCDLDLVDSDTASAELPPFETGSLPEIWIASPEGLRTRFDPEDDDLMANREPTMQSEFHWAQRELGIITNERRQLMRLVERLETSSPEGKRICDRLSELRHCDELCVTIRTLQLVAESSTRTTESLATKVETLKSEIDVLQRRKVVGLASLLAAGGKSDQNRRRIERLPPTGGFLSNQCRPAVVALTL